MSDTTSTSASDPSTRTISYHQTDEPGRNRRQRKELYRKNLIDGSQDGSNKPLLLKASSKVVLSPTILDALRRDVLRSSPVFIKGTALQALDEHLQLIQTEELVLQITGGTHHPMITTTFPAAIQDPCLFTCMMVSAQAFFEARREVSIFKPSSYLLGLYAKGIARVQERIIEAANGQDDRLLASIIHLMITDSVCGNFVQSISHQDGARKIVELRQGKNAEQPLFKMALAVLVVGEFYVSLIRFLSPEPILPEEDNPLKYLRHPFPAAVCVSISGLPQGLQELILTRRISIQTISIMQKINAWSSAIAMISARTGDTDNATYRKLFTDPMSCSRSAIFILRHLQKAGHTLTIEYIFLIGITIVIKHQSAMNLTDHLDEGLLNGFINAIKCFASPTPIETETIIWLTVVIYSRKQYTIPNLAEHLLDYVIQSETFGKDLSAVQATWSRFLWYDTFGGSWTRSWQAGVDRKLLQQSVRDDTYLLAHRKRGYGAREDCLLTKSVIGLERGTAKQSLPSTKQMLARPEHLALSRDVERTPVRENA
jgi:hypothetical protein